MGGCSSRGMAVSAVTTGYRAELTPAGIVDFSDYLESLNQHDAGS